jgi:TRAP-type C4-dicarboxylate transport system permease small subunit
MPRVARRILAFLAVFATLFAQLGVSAYACPGASSGAMTFEAPCEDVDAAQPNLCDKHCHGDQQVGAQVALPFGFVPSFIRAVLPATPRVEASQPRADLRHATSPPQAVSHCRWRI